MNIEKGSIVTVDLGNNSSNTFFVDTIEDKTALVNHPLAKNVLIRVPLDKLNTVQANIKDSTERCIDYASVNRKFIDYNTISDLECVAVFFVLKRKLSPRQKQMLANICGIIASVKFDNDLHQAMEFTRKNSSILDEFNLMWFNNFKRLFTGSRYITSSKQRSAIFNIAGYALAQLESPMAPMQK